MAKDRLIRRAFSAVDGPTTIALEPEFVNALDDICRVEGRSFSDLLREIDAARLGPDRKRLDVPLAAAARVFVLTYFRRQAALWDSQMSINELRVSYSFEIGGQPGVNYRQSR